MNWKKKSWEERFAHLSVDGDGGDDGGAGGDGGGSGADDGGSASDDGGGAAGDGADDVDLTSLAYEDIVRFPQGHKLTQEQLSSLMGHNPRKKEPLTDPTVQQAGEPGQQQQQQQAPTAGKKPAATKQPDPKAPKYDERIKRWRDPVTNKIVPKPKGAVEPAPQAGQQQQQAPALTPQQIAAAAAAGAAQGARPQQPQGGQPQGPRAFYGEGGQPPMAVPDEVMALISSDDPGQFKAGIEQVINGLGNVIMRDVFAIMSHQQKQMMAGLPALITRHSGQTAATDNFYERYPMLDNPTLHPGVDAMGKTVAQQFHAAGVPWQKPNGQYTDDFIDAVAAAVAEATGISVLPEQQTALPPAAPVRKSARTFFNRGPQARPSGATPAQTKMNDIQNTISFRRR